MMKKKGDVKEERRLILVFHLANQELGLDISCVREVLKPQEIHPLPQAPDYFAGVINLRGHIIAVVDLRKKFHVQPAEDKALMRVILCKINPFVVGIIVDSVSEVLNLSPRDIHPTPAIVARQMPGAYLSSIARVGEGRVISVLDLGRILTEEEITHLSGIKNE